MNEFNKNRRIFRTNFVTEMHIIKMISLMNSTYVIYFTFECFKNITRMFIKRIFGMHYIV